MNILFEFHLFPHAHVSWLIDSKYEFSSVPKFEHVENVDFGCSLV